jgi:threonylcarbamoyladenosine tRNA methylthiotransferase MtaB
MRSRAADVAAAPAKRPRVSILTFGCRVNQYESEAMSALLARTCELTDRAADVYVLNGCSVTGLAEKKARQAVRRIRAAQPHAVVIVTGCLGESVVRGMSTFGLADAVAGNAWKARITEVVLRALAGQGGVLPPAPPPPLDAEVSAGSPRRVRTYLKVQDGCSGACAYCRAVQLRGAPRSKTFRAAVDEARRLIAAGFPEIVLTGVNLAEFASPDGGALPELARCLLGLPGLARLRLASINVTGITDGLLSVFAADARLCPHFHVPLQSGDDDVLRAMRRTYTAAAYRDAVARIRCRLPHATIGSDIIVGFPGEDDAAFAATCEMVEDIGFSNLHVFRFSPRPGTEADGLPGAVSDSTKQDRALHLAAIWNPVRRRLLDACLGNVEDVLIETRRNGRYYGHTASYIETAFTSAEAVRVGALCRVRVTAATEHGLEGVHDESHCPD